MLHRFSHEDRVGGGGNGGVHQNPVGSHLHGQSSVGGGADSSVDNQRHFSDALAKDLESRLVLNPEPAADRCGQWHHGSGPHFN